MEGEKSTKKNIAHFPATDMIDIVEIITSIYIIYIEMNN